MRAYQDLLRYILENGKPHSDRTGVGTTCVFGHQFRHRLKDGFPLLTTKKLHWKSIIVELLWMLQGQTNIAFLHEHGVTIWDEWADKDGELGPVYGKQWRAFSGVRDIESGLQRVEFDQLRTLDYSLQNNPDSRRLCVSAWNPVEISKMKLPPCHLFWQCRVIDGELHLHMVMRSTDAFLGLPFNLASYAALLCLLAKRHNLTPGDIVISFGDLHIYNNHREQVDLQLSRPPRPLPVLQINPFVRDMFFDELEPSHFEIAAYDPHPPIKAPVAV